MAAFMMMMPAITPDIIDARFAADADALMPAFLRLRFSPTEPHFLETPPFHYFISHFMIRHYAIRRPPLSRR